MRWSTTLSKYKLWVPVWLIPCLSYGHDYGSAAMVLVPGIATVHLYKCYSGEGENIGTCREVVELL